MPQKPILCIVSSSNTKPKSLIKLITKCTEISNDTEPNKVSHQWIIDTKYYTANIDVFGIDESFIRNEDFNNNVEALIVHMDSNKETGLADLGKWDVLEKDCEPDIKIIITNYCSEETKVQKSKAIEWCLKRGYELIELYPNVSAVKEEKDQDLIEEKFGVDRVVEVLQTHVWSNLVMKNKADSEPSNKINSGMECIKRTNDEEVDDVDILNNDGTDDFTELFAQLQIMKESIQSMPMRERKQCAEQIVTAFWHAIGGDEEEIADL